MFFRCPNLCVGMCSMSLFPPAPLCQFSPSNGRSHRWDCNLTSHLLAQFHQQIPSEGLSLVWRGTTSLQEFPVLGMSWLSFQVCASCTSRWQRCDSVQPSDKILIKKEKPTLKPIFVRLGLNSLTLAYRTPRDPFWAVKIGLLDVQGNQLEISYWKLISRSWWENSYEEVTVKNYLQWCWQGHNLRPVIDVFLRSSFRHHRACSHHSFSRLLGFWRFGQENRKSMSLAAFALQI